MNHTHYCDLIKSFSESEKNTYSKIFLAPPVLECVSTEIYIPPLVQNQLFYPRCTDSQSWSSFSKKILPVSGNSMQISENLSLTSLRTLTDQKNNLVIKCILIIFMFLIFRYFLQLLVLLQ